MQGENTLHYLRRKLSAISEGRGSVFDPYDLDRFQIRLPLHYHDSYLDSPPSEEAVRELEEEGCPRWPLVSKGSVNQATAFLAFRRNRRLASPVQARLLRAQGHPRPWSVRETDVSRELVQLQEGRRRELC
jgi:hypothetical protein